MPVRSPAPAPTPHRLALALTATLGLALGACSKQEEAPAPAASTAAPVAAEAPAEQTDADRAAAAAAALAALSADELRSRGGQALREQRLYAPAGDNAMEYYLALRSKSERPDASAESALVDLMPYAIIAAEQAIGREDFVEAERLAALIERADTQAPALPRIRDSIAKGRIGAEQRAAEAVARAEEEQRAREEAARRAAEEAAAAASAPPPTAQPAPTQPAVTQPQPQPAAAQPAATPPPAQPAAQPAPPPVAARTTPVPLSTPQPDFPAQALRAGITGEVEFEYTIARDGSVSDVRIVRAQPRGTFERSVLSTVRRWRFEPLDQEVTQTTTVVFR
ncbi:MAG TPA: energy transducer TonB [Arenimonas sp.]|nr:energy transducer TonB [Arenimonas sp.]